MLLIMPHLHYSNATLTGLLAYQHCRLLSASLNAATRLIYWTSRCHHTTPATASLSRECVDLKLSVLICVRGLAPDYLSDDMHRIANTNRQMFVVVGSNDWLTRLVRSCLSHCQQQTLEQFTA